MKKKYVSPLFAEIEIEDVLFASNDDSENSDGWGEDWGGDSPDDEFDF